MLTSGFLKRRYLFLILVLFWIPIHSSFGQKTFVTFETTNKSNTICQGKTLGIIATIEPGISKFQGFKWLGDSLTLRKTSNEIAVVNTQKSGEKKITFSLTLENGIILDTSIVIVVLPKPEVQIRYDNNNINIFNKHEVELVDFSWFYDGSLIHRGFIPTFANPQKGNYKVMVKDKNGCVSTSDPLEIL